MIENEMNESLLKTCKYLVKATRHLSTDDQFTATRTNMMRNLLEMLNLPRDKLYGPQCSQCGIYFKVCPPSQRILPAKKKNRFYRRLEKGKEKMTKYQHIASKKLKKIAQNKQKMVITCQKCQHQFISCILSSNKPNKNNEEEFPEKCKTDKEKNKLKQLKKKEKRRFAGLNKNAVLAASKHLNPNLVTVRSKEEIQKNSKQKENSIEVIDLITPMKKPKKKPKAFSQVLRLTKETEKAKVANSFMNLLSTAPSSESSCEKLKKFLC